MTIYRILVTLLDTRPAIWRRIELSSQTTLKQFHLILQVAMGWENLHMHTFEVGPTRFGVRGRAGDPMDSMVSERGISLAHTLPLVQAKLLYTYDIGDDWRHEAVLEAMLPPVAEAVCPRLIDGARSCPPEDCGGASSYADLLSILKNPAHKEYAEMREWVGRRFDPEAFELEDKNHRLQRNRSLAAKH